MKYDNLFYSFCLIMLIAGAILKILHLPYAEELIFIGITTGSIFQAIHVAILKRRIAELETKLANK